MAEQEANDPGVDVRARRFGEQQQAAGLEHAMELRKRFFLADQVMKGLVTEDEVHARVGKREIRDVAVS